jgi:antirestriction protein ArdC
MSTTQIDTPYQIITDRILALLAQGTVPWQQPVRRDS